MSREKETATEDRGEDWKDWSDEALFDFASSLYDDIVWGAGEPK